MKQKIALKDKKRTSGIKEKKLVVLEQVMIVL
jgi:hypothetical protein